MKRKSKKRKSKTNKIFPGIIVITLIISGAFYFGFREFVRTSEYSKVTELESQLASLEAQMVLTGEPAAPAATSTDVLGSEPELEEEVNACDSLDCDSLNDWVNSGATFSCQNDDGKTCTCRTQVYHNYSCSISEQKCVYSITDTKINKYSCVEPEPVRFPDLITKSLSFSPDLPVEGNEMTFGATLKNQGEAAAASSKSYLKIDGEKIAEFSTTYLSSNGSKVVTWSKVWTAVIGEHELEVCADGASVVDESYELNNCTAMTFTVAEAIPQPDLIVESVFFVPDPLTPGHPVSFSCSVRNQGDAAAKPTLTVARLDLGNDGDWDKALGAESTQGLAINMSETEIWREVWMSIPGEHKIKICADARSELDLRVAESDESNNCYSLIFTVE